MINSALVTVENRAKCINMLFAMGTTFVLKWGLHPVRLNSVIVSNIAAVRVIYDAETICP